MAVTLAEAKVGMTNKVDQQVVDEFRRDSLLLDRLTFDDTVSPGTNGSTLGYSYIRLKTPSTVKVRELNTEYTPGHAVREEKTSKVVPFGGSFEIDRVIAETSGAVDEVSFQIKEKSKAAANYFHYVAINGSGASSGAGYETKTFDGLKKILTGTDTEFTTNVDVSSSALLDTNYNALLDEVDTFLSKMARRPDILMMNGTMLTKMRSAARRAGYYERTKNDFGNYVETYAGVPMVDMGQYWNGTDSVDTVPVESDGTTAIYAACLGLDAFHGISVKGEKMVTSHLPNFAEAGSVKKGDVEMLAGVVLKNSKMAGVLKGIKVKATE